MSQSPFNRRVVGWALYDWANSAFATTVIAGFFPIFFREFWVSGEAATDATVRLGLANGAAGFAIAISAPLLGAVADHWGARKKLLLGFAFVGCMTTAGLLLVDAGQWQMAAALYIIASIGFAGSNIFYDALLVSVAERGTEHRVSALGFSLGYLGGGVLFAVNVAMTLYPATFGLADSAQAIRLSFLMVALWWAGFSLPLLLWVDEENGADSSIFFAIGEGLRQLRQTFSQLRRVRPALIFLLAYFCYIDGVNTVIKMALDFGLAIGFSAQELVGALLLVQFVGFPAALGFGWLGQRFGAKQSILLGLAGYIGATVWASNVDSVTEFYGIAALIGLVQGGVQALSRSLFSQLIPRAQAGSFFGFYNMFGRFATIIGPLLVALTAELSGDPRRAILSVLLLFGLGIVVLLRVDAGAQVAD